MSGPLEVLRTHGFCEAMMDALGSNTESEDRQCWERLPGSQDWCDSCSERMAALAAVEQQASEIERLRAEALAFDNVREAFDDTWEENRRLTEGLREVIDVEEELARRAKATGRTLDEAFHNYAANTLRALLAGEPDGDGGEVNPLLRVANERCQTMLRALRPHIHRWLNVWGGGGAK